MLQNLLFPKKTVQIVRSVKDSDLELLSDQEISSDLYSINTNLNP